MDRMKDEDLALFIENTVHVLTTGRDRLAEWRRQLKRAERTARQAGSVADVELLQALQELLAGEAPALPADHLYAADLAKVYALMRNTSNRLSDADLKVLVVNTVAVRTGAMAQRAAEWRASIVSLQAAARKEGAAWEAEVQLFEAVLAILAGQRPALPEGHAYADVLERIYGGIDAGGLQERAIDDQALYQLLDDMILAMSDPSKLATMRRHLKQGRRRSQERRLKPEVEFYTALLALVDGKVPHLSEDSPYTEAMEALGERILKAMGQIDEAEAQAVGAVYAFVKAEDWDTAEAVVREQEAVLLSDRALAVLDELIDESESDQDEDGVTLYKLHRGVLVACRQNGISETFTWLREQADLDDDDDDDDAAWDAADDDDDDEDEDEDAQGA